MALDIFGNFGNSSLYPHNGSKTEAKRKQHKSSESIPIQAIGILWEIFGMDFHRSHCGCFSSRDLERCSSNLRPRWTRQISKSVSQVRLGSKLHSGFNCANWLIHTNFPKRFQKNFISFARITEAKRRVNGSFPKNISKELWNLWKGLLTLPA